MEMAAKGVRPWWRYKGSPRIWRRGATIGPTEEVTIPIKEQVDLICRHTIKRWCYLGRVLLAWLAHG